jgi:AcrR family transcriptional regulator
MKHSAKIAGEKNTREQIMDAAIDLFAQKGYDAVSIREIARAVGIRESSIYNHYKGKEDIMDSIINFFVIELSKPDPDEVPMEVMLQKYAPDEYLIVAGTAYMTRLKEERVGKVWRLISIELYRNKKVRDFFKTTMMEFPLQAWEQTFRKMMDLGYIQEYDARQLAAEFFYYCIFLFFDYFYLRYDEVTYDEFIDGMIDNLRDHIRFMFEKLTIKAVA